MESSGRERQGARPVLTVTPFSLCLRSLCVSQASVYFTWRLIPFGLSGLKCWPAPGPLLAVRTGSAHSHGRMISGGQEGS